MKIVNRCLSEVGSNSSLFSVIALFLLIMGCNKPVKTYERPMDPWAFRSVLDRNPRMLTLALHPELFVAYDLERSQLYKVWKGGVFLEGTVFTNKKNVQPTSWGTSYLEPGDVMNRWSITYQGNRLPDITITHKGYRFENNQLWLGYTITHKELGTFYIEERPECAIDDEGKPGLVRTFSVKGLVKGAALTLSSEKSDFKITKDGYHELRSSFAPLADQLPPSLGEQYDHLGILRMETSDCFTCHEEVNDNVGPSFSSIAARYGGDKSVYPYLTGKIQQGGKGVWGDVQMNAHPDLTDADIRPMLDYIMTYAPKSPTAPSTKPKMLAAAVVEEKKVSRPGFGSSLEGVHPSFSLSTLHHSGFQPRVGGLAFLPDGRLLVSTWDKVGGVYLLDGVMTGDSTRVNVKRIAAGLAEPLGLEVVDGEIYVLQKHELTRLVDVDGDEVIDAYESVCSSWGVTDDFHEFAFGLLYKENHFYITLSMAMRLKSTEKQHPDRGRTLKISKTGEVERLDYGLRTPNGIGEGIDGELFVADNQGQWLPANKIIHVQKDAYNGMAWGLPEGLTEIPRMVPPAIWLPDAEIGNSPTEPILMVHGPYKGQLLHGDVTHGGIKRDFLEKINGSYQGAVFRFTQGLHAGVNRLVWGSDGDLYIGEIGMVGGWSWKERQYGLEKLTYTGASTFEMLAIRARPNGFEIEFTEPLHDKPINKDDFLIQQWWYLPTASYGGPKKDLEQIVPSQITVSPDRRRVYLELQGLKREHVVYFLLSEAIKNEKGRPLWSGEAWYTLNKIPTK
nr:cytochrome C [Cytophagales bacterium]